MRHCRPLKLLPKLAASLNKAALRKKKTTVFHPHKAILSVSTPGRIVTEFSLAQFMPCAIPGSYPLIAEAGFSPQLPVGSAKVFAETIQTA